MKGKLGAVVLCLVFALPFGGVGAWATYALVTMVHDSIRAKDWVRVKADVTGPSSYRYSFQGATYSSDRLGVHRFGGTDNTDDFHDRMADLFAQAREKQRPITVYVNPDQPSEAMADRTFRWPFALFLTPFAFGFGGVGLGALYVISRIVRAPAGGWRKNAPAAAAMNAGDGLAGVWIFAFFWNVISLPIAGLALPEIVRNEEWIGLLVLIFPLVGIALLWWAISATIGRLRRGGAQFAIKTAAPRIGGPLEGHVEFARGVRSGDRFTVRLVCSRTSGNDDESSSSTFWMRDLEVKAISTGTAARLPFRFDVPSGLPATSSGEDQPVSHAWRIEVEPAVRAKTIAYSKEIEMQPAAFAAEAPIPMPASPTLFEPLEKMLGADLTAAQKSSIAQMTPQQQAAVARVIGMAPSARKVIIAIVCVVVAMEVLPMVFRLVH